MNLLFLHILLAFAWMALTGGFTSKNFLVGFVLAIPVIWLSQRGEGTFLLTVKLRRIASFLAFFLWELVKASIRVAHDVLTPRHHMRPGVIDVPMGTLSDAEILLLTTIITLTPGTLSLDVSSSRRTLYIHAMYIDDPDKFRQTIQQEYERRVREVLR